MLQTIHTTQIFTLFGGAYVHEDHGNGPALGKICKASGTRRTAVVCALLTAVTTTAAALTAANYPHTPLPNLWQQNPPTILLKLPDWFGLENALY
jgi:hypothetical protein